MASEINQTGQDIPIYQFIYIRIGSNDTKDSRMSYRNRPYYHHFIEAIWNFTIFVQVEKQHYVNSYILRIFLFSFFKKFICS